MALQYKTTLINGIIVPKESFLKVLECAYEHFGSRPYLQFIRPEISELLAGQVSDGTVSDSLTLANKLKFTSMFRASSLVGVFGLTELGMTAGALVKSINQNYPQRCHMALIDFLIFLKSHKPGCTINYFRELSETSDSNIRKFEEELKFFTSQEVVHLRYGKATNYTIAKKGLEYLEDVVKLHCAISKGLGDPLLKSFEEYMVSRVI
jgi:hypothetical protein